MVAVAVGANHTIAVKTDGTLWTWGINYCGQLGDGTTTHRNIPTCVGVDSKWKSVAAGWDNSIALKTDGSLWAWDIIVTVN